MAQLNNTIIDGLLRVNNSIIADNIIKVGGTSSQFLKADGSIDINTYIQTSAISTNITTDAASDTKTASPKAVKTYVDDAITAAITTALNTAV